MTIETIPGTRAIGQRLAQGELDFVAQIEQSGFTNEDAWKIFNTWRKFKCAKRERGCSGRWTVTHGGFWEVDALRPALAVAIAGK